MRRKKKAVDTLPEEFSSYEEAAEFWDTHDTTDYHDASRPVKMVSEFRGRHYEIEIEVGVAEALRSQAKREGVRPSHLANDLLRQQLATLTSAKRSAKHTRAADRRSKRTPIRPARS
ncbi:MAG TPA: CopG family antitoxin [Anaerolineae bacterium]|nr:CopG family antitoxin [Anaerolineae bacterium]